MDKCKHGFDHACLICGFTHIDGKKVWFDWAWQEQQKQIDELNQNNEKLCLDHAAYNKGVKNIIQEKLKQIEGRDFTIAAMERSFVLANAKVDELQARLDAALKETQHALRYVEEDMRGNHEFLQMAMIRTFKSLAQALKGGEV
ncbi:hypothetical protein F950_02963 [Acinetobacter soli NIPH 2899]|uniref:Uncharacterized protein n=2 Tax=Acinetobacter soli TaxID=487316 RepID=A0ABP2U6E3_9GAMM|nr:hypothetical protein F950_02963 [Acinetobacter soli NIPH 2899]